MGIFDKFTKNNENKENEEIKAPGWDAITELCDKVYPNQNKPKHYGTLVSWQFGGNDQVARYN